MPKRPSQPISYGRRLSTLAARHPDRPAIVFVPDEGEERTISWRELDRTSNRVARLLARSGVAARSLVVIGLPNWPEHYVATLAAWKLGALVLPLAATMPRRERDQVLALGDPALVIADWEGVAYPMLNAVGLRRAEAFSDRRLPDRIPHPGKAMGSGGATGRPKIIVDPLPQVRTPLPPGARNFMGLAPGQVQLVAGPLYHNSPFGVSHTGLFEEHTLILMERFNAARAVDLIERHRVNFAFLAPTMMSRIIQLPGVGGRDFSSVDAIFHTAAPCPPWLKRAWIELLGGEKIYEGYGATEAVGYTAIRGDEWLAHPGSVGRPEGCALRILDEDGRDLPPGEIGEIFMRPHDDPRGTYYYLGSPPAKSTPDGFTSVGDLGWVDAEGYLYFADRRVDMIVTGGANVYPAEVEGALSEHPDVGDVIVIGVPDADWGRHVHAIVEPRDATRPPAVMALDTHCRARLTSYKVPKSYEFVDVFPRDASGKVRRSALVEERAAGDTPEMIRINR
ncbi:MAG TPA: AMP-binding protein [Thermomicrobiales bacterium]|nr:AMP-binding protein [Thermomicrobiales bacterium]